jgi:Ca-activated chloride channel family protein
MFDLFAGEQLVVVGRYKKAGPAKVVITGNVAGKNEKLEFPVELSSSNADEKTNRIRDRTITAPARM